jgi:hypothetical protein
MGPFWEPWKCSSSTSTSWTILESVSESEELGVKIPGSESEVVAEATGEAGATRARAALSLMTCSQR